MLSLLLAAALAGPVVPAAKTPPTPPAPPVTAVSASDLGYVTAGELAVRCYEKSAAGTSYCFAYIAAVHDSVRAYELWLHLSEFCVPRGTPQSDLRRAFLDHLLAHSGDQGGQAASVIVGALKQRYPCVRK